MTSPLQAPPPAIVQRRIPPRPTWFLSLRSLGLASLLLLVLGTLACGESPRPTLIAGTPTRAPTFARPTVVSVFPYCQPDIGENERTFTRKVKILELGFRTAETGTVIPVPAESLTIAGDMSIVDIQALAQYRISDLEDFVSNVADPEGCPDGATLRDAGLAAMSEVVGEQSIGDLLSEDRESIEDEATRRLQRIVDVYRSGMEIVSVLLEQVLPPEPVQDAYMELARAGQDISVLKSQAEAYRSEVVARARSEADTVLQAGQTAKSLRVDQALAEAQRFVSILLQYDREQNATLKERHLDSLDDILPGFGEFINVVGSSSMVAPLVGMPMAQVNPMDVVHRAGLGEPRDSGGPVPLPVNPDVHFDNRLLRIDLPPSTVLDINNQALIIDVYARYRVADRRQFEESLGTEAAARARLTSIIMDVVRAQIAATSWQEIIGGRADGEGGVVGMDFREQMRQEALLEVFKVVEAVDPPLGLTVSEVRTKHLSYPDDEVSDVYDRMRAEAGSIARGLRTRGEVDAASIRASADTERATILAASQQKADAIEAEGEAIALDMIIEAVGQVPGLSSYVGSLEAYKLAGGLKI